MKTILAPIDFSRVTRRVIAHAMRFAGAGGGQVILLHVVAKKERAARGDRQRRRSADCWTRREQAALDRLAALRREFDQRSIAVHAVHRRGQAGDGILAEAKTLPADCIVIGSRGETGRRGRDGTIRRVLEAARSPVVIIPWARSPGR